LHLSALPLQSLLTYHYLFHYLAHLPHTGIYNTTSNRYLVFPTCYILFRISINWKTSVIAVSSADVTCGEVMIWKKNKSVNGYFFIRKLAYFIHINFSSQGSNRAANLNNHKHTQHFLSYSLIKTHNNTQTIQIVTHLPNNNNTGRCDLFETGSAAAAVLVTQNAHVFVCCVCCVCCYCYWC
jgi:hypothetical protein